MKKGILTWSRGTWGFCLKYRLIILVLLVLGACFYWFEWRPTEIKKECSYVPYKIEAVTELTQETIDKEKADLAACRKKYPDIITKNDMSNEVRPSGALGKYFDLNTTTQSLSTQCEGMPNGYGEVARHASPEGVGYRRADPSEYNFCLHSHGL